MDSVGVVSGAGLLGHLQEFRDHPVELLTRFNRELGPVGRMRLGPTYLLVANSPELIHELLVQKHAHFQKSRVVRAGLAPLAGEGLFTSEGALWKRQRKLMAPIFHAKRIADFDRCMVGCAEAVVETWQDGQTFDALHDTTAIAMNVAAQALFGTDISAEGDELGDALTVALDWVAETMTSLPFAMQVELAEGVHKAGMVLPGRLAEAVERIVKRLERPIMWPTARNRELQAALATLEERVTKMIADRRADAQPRKDLLSRLLFAHGSVDDDAMSDKQLRDEILTLFVAGHETTATALAWSIYLLARHRDVREALEREVDALGDKQLAADDLPRLDLASRIFKEALRLYPPVPVYERQAIEPVELGGVPLEDGDYVAVFPWALHHREEVWAEPHRFDPDRFLGEVDRYGWIPFGAGARVCIGNHFALQEGPLVLAAMARRARLDLADDAEIEIDPHSATARPRGGVPVRVRLR